MNREYCHRAQDLISTFDFRHPVFGMDGVAFYLKPIPCPAPLHHRDTARWVDLIIQQRKARNLTQVQTAKKAAPLSVHITLLETGQRRLDVIEFMGHCER